MSRLFFEASRPTFGAILRSVKIVDFCQKYGVRKRRDMWWLKNRRDMLFLTEFCMSDCSSVNDIIFVLPKGSSFTKIDKILKVLPLLSGTQMKRCFV